MFVLSTVVFPHGIRTKRSVRRKKSNSECVMYFLLASNPLVVLSEVVCFCPSYSDCDEDSSFTLLAGVLTVRGPVEGEHQSCTAGLACALGPFSGVNLDNGGSDKVAFITTAVGINECATTDKDAAITIAQGSYLTVQSLVATTNEYGVSMAIQDLPKGGQWKICYCANYDSCDAAEDFTVEAGTLMVTGADGIGLYLCYKENNDCILTVSGAGQQATDYVKVLDETAGSPSCTGTGVTDKFPHAIVAGTSGGTGSGTATSTQMFNQAPQPTPFRQN